MEVSACDLTRIESCGGRLTVGAMVRERLAERSADVTKSVPLLAGVVLIGADTPFRATAAEAVLTGAAPGPSVFEEAAHTAQGDLDPPSDLHGTAAYRRHVAGVLIGASYRAVAGSVAMAVEKTTKARQTCSPSAQSSRTH
jgi:CO/xanthine dehydrogenase FAD-binding subunit